MSDGKNYGQDTYRKQQTDIRDGLTQLREKNLAKRIAKQMEETGKNIIIGELCQ